MNRELLIIRSVPRDFRKMISVWTFGVRLLLQASPRLNAVDDTASAAPSVCPNAIARCPIHSAAASTIARLLLDDGCGAILVRASHAL